MITQISDDCATSHISGYLPSGMFTKNPREVIVTDAGSRSPLRQNKVLFFDGHIRFLCELFPSTQR